MSFKNLCAALCGIVLLGSQASAAHLSLIVTGVFDGPLTGGLPKVIELYAVEDIPDLSRWAVGSANNGGGTDGPETVLAGIASAGDFLYVVDGIAEFAAYFPGQIPVGAPVFDGSFATGGGGASINGDDAIEVFFDVNDDDGFAVVGDVFGDINVDGSGEPWDYLDGWAYRKDGTTATDPDMNPLTPSPFVVSDYTYSGINVNDNQLTNLTAPTPFPIGTYNPLPEPTSLVLFALGTVGLLASRKRG